VVFLEVVKVPELKPPQSTHTGGQQLHMFLGFVPHKQTEMLSSAQTASGWKTLFQSHEFYAQ
jgi:hypothetical protein